MAENIDIKQLIDGDEQFYPQTDIHALVNDGEYAIDDEPTAGSENLVKSKGISKYVKTELYSHVNNVDRENVVAINPMNKPTLDILYKADTISYTVVGVAWEQICIRINNPIIGTKINLSYTTSFTFAGVGLVCKDKNYNTISGSSDSSIVVVNNSAYVLLLFDINHSTVINPAGSEINISDILLKYEYLDFKSGEHLKDVSIEHKPTKGSLDKIVSSDGLAEILNPIIVTPFLNSLTVTKQNEICTQRDNVLYTADEIVGVSKATTWSEYRLIIPNPIIGKNIVFEAHSVNNRVVNCLVIHAKDSNDSSIKTTSGNPDNIPVLQIPQGTDHVYCSIFFADGAQIPSGTETTFNGISIYYKDDSDELGSRIDLLESQITGMPMSVDSLSVLIDATVSTHSILRKLENKLYAANNYNFTFNNPDNDKTCVFHLGFKDVNGEWVSYSVNGSAFSTGVDITINNLSSYSCNIVFESDVIDINFYVIQVAEGGYNNTISTVIGLLGGLNLPLTVENLHNNLVGRIGNFISLCKSFTLTNALTVTHFERLLSIDELVITTNTYAWQSVDWYFNNPVVGNKVSLTVSNRENGANRIGTLRCYDCLFDGSNVDNSHILQEVVLNSSGTVSLVVPDNTKSIVAIFSACFGTALENNTVVTLSGIRIEYTSITDTSELQSEVDALQVTSASHSNQIQDNTTDINDLKNISDLQQSIAQYSRDITALQQRLQDLNNSFNEDHTINDNLNPVPIILDTDFGGDVDDALAVRVLSYFESIGTVRTICVGHPGTATNLPKAISAMLQYDGTTDVPIIIHNQPSWPYSGYTELLSSYPHYANDEYRLYGYQAYRKALSELTRKCIMVFTGPYGNLSELLNSQADEYSELNGSDLIATKVEKIFLMGGSFPDSTVWMNDGSGGVIGREWNIAGNIPAANNVILNCPVPLIFCGWEIGRAVRCGGGLADKLPPGDAMVEALRLWGGDAMVANGRDGYDPITVAAACLGDTMKMGIELVRGTVHLDTGTGFTTFTESPNGNHYYMKLPYADVNTNQETGYKKYVNVDYYKIYMNHILGKDWWGANNMCKKDRLL